jgi:hypothetical protein
VAVAGAEFFQVLKERAPKVVLESPDACDLGARQHAARSARAHTDPLGMVHIDLALEPQVGTPIVNRAKAEAGRLYRAARKEGDVEPLERHLADAYAGLLRARSRSGPGGPSSSCS